MTLTPMDEQFIHQLPEPLANVAVHSEHWRESLFFIMHPRDGEGDVLAVTMASYPARQVVDSLQLGRVGEDSTAMLYERQINGDPQTLAVGPVAIDIVEPWKIVHVRVGAGSDVPVVLDVTFTARTAPHLLRRGTMRAGDELIWDQRHIVQSGTYNGSYTRNGVTHEVVDWWGQRDHSWGVREHARCPLWIWLAVQLPEGMV